MTTKNRDQLRNPMLGSWVWPPLFFTVGGCPVAILPSSAGQSKWEERMHGTVVGYNFKLQRVAATDQGVMQRKLHLVYTYSYSGQKSLSITKNSFTDSTNQIAVFA